MHAVFVCGGVYIYIYTPPPTHTHKSRLELQALPCVAAALWFWIAPILVMTSFEYVCSQASLCGGRCIFRAYSQGRGHGPRVKATTVPLVTSPSHFGLRHCAAQVGGMPVPAACDSRAADSGWPDWHSLPGCELEHLVVCLRPFLYYAVYGLYLLPISLSSPPPTLIVVFFIYY